MQQPCPLSMQTYYFKLKTRACVRWSAFDTLEATCQGLPQDKVLVAISSVQFP